MRKPSPIKTALANLMVYLRRYQVALGLALLFSILGSLASLMGPDRLSHLTDTITAGMRSSIDMEKVKSIALGLVLFYVSSFLFNYAQGFIMATLAQKVSNAMRKDLSEKIDRLPLSYFDTQSLGDSLSRITNDVDTVAQTMNQSLASLLSAIVTLVGATIMMMKTNLILSMTGIITALLGFFGVALLMVKSQPYFRRQQEELGRLNGHVEESITGHTVLKAFGAEDFSEETFTTMNDALKQSAWKSQFLSGTMMPIMFFIGNFSYVLVCVVGALLVNRGSITFGTIVAFMVYIRLFTQPLQSISQGLNNIQRMAAASERVFEFLRAEEMEDESKKPGHLPEIRGEVEFSHVGFGYEKNHPIIHDFSCHVAPGEKVAIVGPTGAGKSTLVNLLMRFYDVDKGRISIDGVDIATIPRDEVRKLFGMVLQDTWMFEGTVRENLAYNKQGVIDEDLARAAEATGLTELIDALPEGYDTVLTEDVALSQGQKQLFTIARAMVEDAPLLILDEATSSVDTRTELLVQQAMDRLTQGRTSFVIAHRLSTIKNADTILVLRDGDVVESGTHEELLALGGFYADLYMSQFDDAA